MGNGGARHRYLQRKAVIEANRRLLDTVHRTEVGIAGRPSEWIAAFNPLGQRVIYRRGQEGQIDPTPDELALMRGAVITHNHPHGGPFTADDIALAAETGAREIRAVSEHHIYSMTPPSGGWDKAWYDREIASRGPDILRTTFGPRAPDVMSGRVEHLAAMHEAMHEMWQQLARETGMHYRRIKWEPFGEG